MDIKKVNAISKTIRALSIDAIEKANSGHPGLPLGCADMISVLFTNHIHLNPHNPKWLNRDRFILSAGHGSMLLYSILHLSGFDITLDDLKNFREVESKTPGHPEYGHTPGVEATTGPLGAGVSNGVGISIAQEHMASRFNIGGYSILDSYTYVLAGDGCLMEGISYEACSLAGHLGLGRLILFYDSNRITIEGSTDLSTSEDVLLRFKSQGWQTLECDGHNPLQINEAIKIAKSDKKRPTIIKFNTVIGYGSPNKEGTSGIHGSPLGKDEVIETRKRLSIPVDRDFYIEPYATESFNLIKEGWLKEYNSWQDNYSSWEKDYPELKKEMDNIFSYSYDFNTIKFSDLGDSISTRKASGIILNTISSSIPSLIGGSADLSPSTNSYLKEYSDFTRNNRGGRNIHFGIREHAMGGVINGLALYGGLRPFASTFLVFSDYMRPSIRLSALMKLPVIYIFTHDSVYLGKDGPTHQPIEQLESLRAIPNLMVLRPGDWEEAVVSWEMALKNIDGPTALILSRQNLQKTEKSREWIDDYKNGGHRVYGDDKSKKVIYATGSEVNLAISVARESESSISVISISDRKKFYQNIFKDDNRKKYAVEAGIPYGWATITGSLKRVLGIETFGLSGSGENVANIINFNKEELTRVVNDE